MDDVVLWIADRPWVPRAAAAFVIGAGLASFLCVVAERVPAGLGLGGRSRCACGIPIPARWNVPVLGWILARGRARCCGAPIPPRYPLAEAALGTWCAVWAAAAPVGVAALAALAGAVVLVAVDWGR